MKGYITFADASNNISDKITIRGYADDIADSKLYTEYVFDKITGKLLRRAVSDDVYLPYTAAVSILDEALSMDKRNVHYVEMSFVYIQGTKPTLKIERVVKELFPLPHKNITYQQSKTFVNVTSALCGKVLLTNLEASVYAHHYNSIAVRSGIADDRLFEYSCGRLLMQADLLMKSIEGSRLLKSLLGDSYPTVRSNCRARISRRNIFHTAVKKSMYDNQNFVNDFLRAQCIVAQKLSHLTLADAFANPDCVSDLIGTQMQIYEYEFQREYYSNLVSNIASYHYLGIKDILRMHIDADFRLKLDKYVSDIRKVYNANKNRAEFCCVLSDGRLVM